MPDNKGDRAVTDLHTPPEGQPLLGYPMPEPEAPVDPTLPAPATLDPATAAAIGRQYRDQLYARCAVGDHQPKTIFGVCGIVTAIAFFPFGLICLFADTKKQCARCGVTLEGK